MSWIDDNKNQGVWDFDKQGNKTTYNEGCSIATVDNPVWNTNRAQCNEPITPTHSPGCGYWYKDKDFVNTHQKLVYNFEGSYREEINGIDLLTGDDPDLYLNNCSITNAWKGYGNYSLLLDANESSRYAEFFVALWNHSAIFPPCTRNITFTCHGKFRFLEYFSVAESSISFGLDCCFEIVLCNSKIRLYYPYNYGFTYVDLANPLLLGVDYHLAVVQQNNVLKMYINGSLFHAQPTSRPADYSRDIEWVQVLINNTWTPREGSFYMDGLELTFEALWGGEFTPPTNAPKKWVRTT